MNGARGSGRIYCPRCPAIYDRSEISAIRGEDSTTLAELFGETRGRQSSADRSESRRGRLGRAILGPDVNSLPPRTGGSAPDHRLASGIRRLGAWDFLCPKGHEVDGNRGEQLLFAVVGPSGSSKSHFLPGLIWETDAHQALRTFGVSLREGSYSAPGLHAATNTLYVAKQPILPTPPEAIEGPFGYRLSLNTDGSSSRYSLLLCDVGGEALESIQQIREQAPFVLLSKAFFVLIDPQDLLPSEYYPDWNPTASDQIMAAQAARGTINRVADAIEELWDDTPISQLEIPAVMVIPKADSIIWTFDYQSELSRVIDDYRKSHDLTASLFGSSVRVREAFLKAGGSTVIGEVEDRFDRNLVRWVASSATGQMPDIADDGSITGWSNPIPNGQSLALLHQLDMLARLGTVERLAVNVERLVASGALLEADDHTDPHDG